MIPDRKVDLYKGMNNIRNGLKKNVAKYGIFLPYSKIL